MSTLVTTNLKNPSAGSDNIVLGADGSTRVTTLADSAGANTSTPAEIASGRAKAWVNFNGTGTVAIRASYNVSRITDNGVGDYTVNFTTAMVDADYSAIATISDSVDQANSWAVINQKVGIAPTTTAVSYELTRGTTGQVAFDSVYINVAIFR